LTIAIVSLDCGASEIETGARRKFREDATRRNVRARVRFARPPHNRDYSYRNLKPINFEKSALRLFFSFGTSPAFEIVVSSIGDCRRFNKKSVNVDEWIFHEWLCEILPTNLFHNLLLSKISSNHFAPSFL